MADTNAEFQVISNAGTEDACIEAQTSGPRDVALREAMHYAEQYAEDGPVSVFEHIEVARLGYPSGNYGPTATPPADAALADDALCESLIEASDMRWNGDVYIGDGADLMNLVRAALRARAVQEELPLFDAAIAVELPCVSVVPYNSKEICTWFAKNVRERMLAASKAGGE